jgi:hypothetical protein
MPALMVTVTFVVEFGIPGSLLFVYNMEYLQYNTNVSFAVL